MQAFLLVPGFDFPGPCISVGLEALQAATEAVLLV